MPEFKSEGEAIVRLQRHVHDSEVLVPQVRSAPGFNSKRTADAISIGTWVSRGHSLSLYEIKCTRSDWLAELKAPEKMEPFAQYMNYIWLVVPSKKIVNDGELPDGWGMLASSGNGLRRVVQAQRRDAKPLPIGLVVTMLRAERRQSDASPSKAALQAKYEQGYKEGKNRAIGASRFASLKTKNDTLKAAIDAFEESSGLKIAYDYTSTTSASNLGRQVAAIRAGGIESLKQQIPAIERAVDRIQKGVNAIKSLED